MALGIADQIALEKSREVEIRSAGTAGLIDQPPEPYAITVCRERGIDIRDHRSRALTAELVAWADRILVMEWAHAEAVATLDPSAVDKVVHLGPLAGVSEISDPYGSWFVGAYRQTLDLLETAIRRVID